jgi:hypothetical protein
MGIGAPRPGSATELVALSPGFLDVRPAPEAVASPHGFPEPPPPPESNEALSTKDWIEDSPVPTPEEAAPVSLDDFAEELPPSIPPEEEMPSSTGTPSLKALTHHETPHERARVDDFLANMSAAMNGGLMMGAPTIDVSQLTSAPSPEAPTAELDPESFEEIAPPRRGAKTLPLFGPDPEEAQAPQAGSAASSAAAAAPSLAEGSLSPAALDGRSPADSNKLEGVRERRNVVPPTTRSEPRPPGADAKTSSLAVPLLLALAAVAAFLIWKRSASHAPPEPVAAERAAIPAPPPPPPEIVTPPAAEPPAAAPSAAPAPPEDDITFETVKAAPQVVAPAARAAAPDSNKPATQPAPQPEPAGSVASSKAPQPESPAEPKPPAGPFDRAAAAAALTASASQASACRKEGDPSGVASVVVTFAPSGRVTSANISGPPFAGTPTGGCIAATLRKSQIPAFEGERVTVSKTVVIQ